MFKITHSFHPYSGKQFEIATWQRNWTEDRIYFKDNQQRLRSVPTSWTDLVVEDPSIQRSTKRGLNYDENSGGFIANGQELISREHTWSPRFFGAKFETAFTRYQYARDDTTEVASWLGTTREGIKYYYGSTEASRQQFEAGVFKWYVDRIEDTNGNYVVYNYEKDHGTVYLKSITYSHHAHKDPMYMVMLHYDDQEGDQRTVSYETHYPTKKRWRLGAIDIIYGTSAEPVRKYQFYYDDWCTPGVCGDDTIGLSFLTAIEQIEFREISGTYAVNLR